MSLGERIKTTRKNNNLNQKMFSEQIGVNQSTLSAYENGNALPSVDVLLRIAKTFHVSTDWLLGVTNDIAPISSFGDIFRFLFRLDDVDSLRYEIGVESLFSKGEQTDKDTCVSIKFYSNDLMHPDNAELCDLLRRFGEERCALKGLLHCKKRMAFGKNF